MVALFKPLLCVLVLRIEIGESAGVIAFTQPGVCIGHVSSGALPHMIMSRCDGRAIGHGNEG